MRIDSWIVWALLLSPRPLTGSPTLPGGTSVDAKGSRRVHQVERDLSEGPDPDRSPEPSWRDRAIGLWSSTLVRPIFATRWEA